MSACCFTGVSPCESRLYLAGLVPDYPEQDLMSDFDLAQIIQELGGMLIKPIGAS
jgi:hypothetical protein